MGDIGGKTPANTYKSLVRLDGADDEEFHASSTVKRLTSGGGETGSSLFVSGEHLIVSRQDVTSLTGVATPSTGTFDTHFQNSNELTVRANTGVAILAIEAGSDDYTSGAGTGNLGARIRLISRAYQSGEANNDNRAFGQQMWEIENHGDDWSTDSTDKAARFVIKDSTQGDERFTIKAALGNDGYRTKTGYNISETGMHSVGDSQNEYQFRVRGQGDAKIDKVLEIPEITYYVAADDYDYSDTTGTRSDENDGYDYKKPLKSVDEALRRIEASKGGGSQRFYINIVQKTIDSDGSLATREKQGNWNTIGGLTGDNYTRWPEGDGVNGDGYVCGTGNTHKVYFFLWNKWVRFRGYMYNAQTKTISASLAHKDETSAGNTGKSIASAVNLHWAIWQQTNAMWTPFYLSLYQSKIEFMRINVITPDPTDATLTDSGSATADKSVVRYGYGYQHKGDLKFDGTTQGSGTVVVPTTTTRQNWVRIGTLKEAINDSDTTIKVKRLTGEGNYATKLPIGTGNPWLMIKKSDGTCEYTTKGTLGAADVSDGPSGRFYPFTGVTRGYKQHSSHKVAHDVGEEVYIPGYWHSCGGCIRVTGGYGNGSGVFFQYAPLTLNDFPFFYVGNNSPGAEINHYRSPINLSDRAKEYVKGNLYHNPPSGDTWNTGDSSTCFKVDGAIDNARTTTLVKATNSTHSLRAGYFMMHLPFTTNPFFTDSSCDTTSGAATISHTANSKIVVGLQVRGPGIPYDAYVKSVDTSTQFTIGKLSTVTGENFAGGTSANCTADGTDKTLHFMPSRLHTDGTVTNSGEIVVVVDRVGSTRGHVARGIFGTATDTIADDTYFVRLMPNWHQWGSYITAQGAKHWSNRAWDPLNTMTNCWQGQTSYTGIYSRLYSDININFSDWGPHVSGDGGLRTNTFANETGILENLTNDYLKQDSWHQTGVTPLFADVANGWEYGSNGGPTTTRLNLCQDMKHPATMGDGWIYKGWNVTKENTSFNRDTNGRGIFPYLHTQLMGHQHGTLPYGMQFNQRVSISGIDPDGYNPAAGNQGDGSTRSYGANHSSLLDIQGLGALRVPLLTTAQRDLLDASDGMILYNTSTNKLQVAVDSTWTDLH